MTDIEPEEDQQPVAHVTMVYGGPVAPHWEMKVRYGDQKMLDEFWTRVHARLLLLPKHDPQFRRNRERVNRDAERELIICDWDLGDDDAESTSTPTAAAPGAEPAAPAEAEAAPQADADAAQADPAADAPQADPAADTQPVESGDEAAADAPAENTAEEPAADESAEPAAEDAVADEPVAQG